MTASFRVFRAFRGYIRLDVLSSLGKYLLRADLGEMRNPFGVFGLDNSRWRMAGTSPEMNLVLLLLVAD
jgi:hypothetical protein